MRALVRRSHQVKDPVLRIEDLEIDTSAKTVKRSGQTIHLTPREFALLQFLAFHRGKVVTRTMIWEHLYDEYDENTSNVVDVYIRYLRTKVDKGFERPLILTRWGEGYLLRGESD
jgi:DNA-binding response OmpR family regulator